MDIKTLQTLDEVLHYGSLGEVVVIGHEDWSHLERLVARHMEENTPKCDPEAGYEYGVEDGYNEGYNRCLTKYGLEE